MTPWGLVNCKVFGSRESSLTNRMSELLTYGSVGGVGRKPDPYPALDAGLRFCLTRASSARASDTRRYAAAAL